MFPSLTVSNPLHDATRYTESSRSSSYSFRVHANRPDEIFVEAAKGMVRPMPETPERGGVPDIISPSNVLKVCRHVVQLIGVAMIDDKSVRSGAEERFGYQDVNAGYAASGAVSKIHDEVSLAIKAGAQDHVASRSGLSHSPEIRSLISSIAPRRNWTEFFAGNRDPRLCFRSGLFHSPILS